ncbi:hypothetical protein JB92DRAFT_558081 [Gautieria morchelliformis]|nr:hypothetical protein JB92DRAFT_558081 [Gautieria morchelliformis]
MKQQGRYRVPCIRVDGVDRHPRPRRPVLVCSVPAAREQENDMPLTPSTLPVSSTAQNGPEAPPLIPLFPVPILHPHRPCRLYPHPHGRRPSAHIISHPRVRHNPPSAALPKVAITPLPLAGSPHVRPDTYRSVRVCPATHATPTRGRRPCHNAGRQPRAHHARRAARLRGERHSASAEVGACARRGGLALRGVDGRRGRQRQWRWDREGQAGVAAVAFSFAVAGAMASVPIALTVTVAGNSGRVGVRLCEKARVCLDG